MTRRSFVSLAFELDSDTHSLLERQRGTRRRDVVGVPRMPSSPSDGNLYSSARYVVCQMLQEPLVSTSLACFFMQLPWGQCVTLRIKIDFPHKEGKSSRVYQLIFSSRAL